MSNQQRKKKSELEWWEDDYPLSLDLFFSSERPIPDVTKPAPQSKIAITFQTGGVQLPTYNQSNIPGVSIKKTLEDVNKKKEEEIRTAQMANECVPFTISDFRKAWNTYKDSVPQKKLLQTAMASCIMEFHEDTYQLDIALETDILQNELLNEMPDLLTFLSKTLRNGKIKITTRISEKGENKNVMTASERFEDMLKKNQNLLHLKELFGLETN